MMRNKSASLHFMNFSRSIVYVRQLCSQALLAEAQHYVTSGKNLSVSIKENMKTMQQHQFSLQTNKISIYRVPAKLRKIDPKAYEPHFISIGPYHHGLPNLQASEKLKWLSLNRLVGLSEGLRVEELDKLVTVLEDVEQEARKCYSEDVKLSRDEFVKMMLLDGCFIVELFRELEENNFASSSLLSKRWMLPVVRRDLITLENQLPLIVLKKIFDVITITKSPSRGADTSLEELALDFFDPLMPREKNLRKPINGYDQNFQHLLDVFHSSITHGEVERRKEPHMYRSVTELKEAGIKVRVLRNTQPLELRFERGKLRIPSLLIDNHTGSFFRNIVAYEQCHHDCKPDMTAYLFFLDKLINSTEDVGLLHYEGVIQHSLGSNKQVAKLVNNLCLEVEYDGQESYLCEVVECLNSYSARWLIKAKTRLKHDYFTNLWVGLSTLVALLLLYLTLLQTSCDAIVAQEKENKEKMGSWVGLNMFLLNPFEGCKKLMSSASRCINRVINPADPSPDSPL
uniref:Uncharacterized protein n=1 Tax=Beta vulgaris TaxID=161934 RepID=K4Q461_BETVU|nr:hypothetical protein [Beta vulgaris]